MSSKLKMAAFFLILPLGIIGHDIYLMMESKQSFGLERLSSLGFIFREYAPGVLESLNSLVSRQIFQDYMVPALKIKTAIYAALPSAIMFLLGLREVVKKHITTGKTMGKGSLKSRQFSHNSRNRVLGKKSSKD